MIKTLKGLVLHQVPEVKIECSLRRYIAGPHLRNRYAFNTVQGLVWVTFYKAKQQAEKRMKTRGCGLLVLQAVST